MAIAQLGVAVVGCGLIGRRRASCAAAHGSTKLVAVADSNQEAADEVADSFGCDSAMDWHQVVDRLDVDVVVASTPNAFLHDIAIAALHRGKHVLIEKPMGRNLPEAQSIAQAASRSGKVLKIGFNHRYHPALRAANELVKERSLGKLFSIRARYGHGGRSGYEREWRGSRHLAGGGELTDQGVHIADLMHWMAGSPEQAFSYLQTAVWPIKPLEDNAFGLFRFQDASIGSFHTSWTQWKNLFSFEIFCEGGSITVDGLGGSYNTETLTKVTRRPEGGVPQLETWAYDEPDISWASEWADFVNAVFNATPYWGTPQDGLVAMRMIDALYRSAALNAPVDIDPSVN